MAVKEISSNLFQTGGYFVIVLIYIACMSPLYEEGRDGEVVAGRGEGR